MINTQRRAPQTQDMTIPVIPERWSFTDGSWKDNDIFFRSRMVHHPSGFDGLLGARNVSASLSPLHTEVEALIWAMECMRNLRQFRVTFATDCYQLVKMVLEPKE